MNPVTLKHEDFETDLDPELFEEEEFELSHGTCQCHDIRRSQSEMEGEGVFTESGIRRYGDLVFENLRRYGDLDFEEEEFFEEADSEIIPPRDSRILVQNTSLAPFRYICNLDYDIPGLGRRSICTGTLIGPRTVLTAGHCLSSLTPSRMRIVPGRKGTLEPLPATVATKFIVPSHYAGSSPSDYGIIHLADPIGNTIGFWSHRYQRTSKDPIGTSFLPGSLPLSPTGGKLKVNISGYPADKPSQSSFSCTDPGQPQKRCKHSTLSNPKRHRLCGTYQYRSFNRTVLLAGGILHYLNDTCPGHSGSPVWIKRHSSKGGRVLVGIHVSGDDGSGTIANRAVFMSSSVRQFIISNLL